MRKFMKRLPVYNGKFDKLTIAIALNHFMGGTQMYSNAGWEITTQEGFINAVLDDPEIKMTEKQIRKIVDDYNKKNPVTPNTYRELKQKINELRYRIDNDEEIIKRQAKYIRLPRAKRKACLNNVKEVKEEFDKKGKIIWRGETIIDEDRLRQVIEGLNMFSKRTIKKLFKEEVE